MRTLAVVVLAAGEGTRMRSRLPKVLHRLAGRPMVHYVLDAAAPLNPAVTALVVGRDAEVVRREIGDGVLFAEQRTRLGTGDAVRTARPLLGEVDDVMVLYADTPLLRPSSLRDLLALHRESGAAITLLTTLMEHPSGYGRIRRDPDDRVCGIVEQAAVTGPEEDIHEINIGVYCFRAEWLWSHLGRVRRSTTGEYYLTDLVQMAAEEYPGTAEHPVQAICSQDEMEAMGVNDRVQLAAAERALRWRTAERLMSGGTTIVDPSNTYLDSTVQAGQDTVICPNSVIEGESVIGEGCIIGPNSHIVNSRVGDRCRVWASVVEGADLECDVTVGPFSHLRPGTRLARGAHIGNFVEVKASSVGERTRAGHFSYVGDAEIGADVNIGAGTVTCNYDGELKHRTVIEDGAFIGSDTMLVAPVRVGRAAKTGAGSVVTRDVPGCTVVYGAPAREKRPNHKARSAK